MAAVAFDVGRQPLRVLALGAHADDIEIGCGATLLHLQRSRPVVVRAVVFSATEHRRGEAERGAALLYEDAVEWSLDVDGFEENLFPDQRRGLKGALAGLQSFAPDVVLTHRLADRHQDHRTIAELTWQAFRDHSILQYEIPKWEGDLATPNTYVAIEPSLVDRKVEIIETAFASQADKPWFDQETFRGLARLRGVECGQRYAEGFQADKLILGAAGPRED